MKQEHSQYKPFNESFRSDVHTSEALKSLASGSGKSKSEYLRKLIEKAAAEKDSIMNDISTDAVRGPFYPDDEHPAKTYVEFDGPSGKPYQVFNAVLDGRNHVIVRDPNRDVVIAGGWVSRGHVDETSPLLDQIFNIQENHSFWDDPVYRDWFKKVGLNPDLGRPNWKAVDMEIIKGLDYNKEWSRLSRPHSSDLFCIAGLLNKLLCIDTPIDYVDYQRCADQLERWPHKLDKALFQEAFDRIDKTKPVINCNKVVEVEFLPSWFPVDKYPRGSLSVSNRICELTFDDDQAFEKYWPNNVGGLALEPELHDLNNPLMPDYRGARWSANQARLWVRDQLEKRGVHFLSKEEATKYLGTDEALYWANKQPNSHSLSANPRTQHLMPNMHRTPSDKKWWRTWRPETPLFDKYGSAA